MHLFCYVKSGKIKSLVCVKFLEKKKNLYIHIYIYIYIYIYTHTHTHQL